MRHVFDVLDLIEAEIQARQVRELIQTLDVPNEIIVEIKLREGGADVRGELYARDLVLS